MAELSGVRVSALSVCDLVVKAVLLVEWCSLTAVGGEDIWFLSVRHASVGEAVYYRRCCSEPSQFHHHSPASHHLNRMQEMGVFS